MRRFFSFAVVRFIHAKVTFIVGLVKNQLKNFPPAAKDFLLGNNGHVYGKIVDGKNKAISEAPVLVLQSKFDTQIGETYRDVTFRITGKTGSE